MAMQVVQSCRFFSRFFTADVFILWFGQRAGFFLLCSLLCFLCFFRPLSGLFFLHPFCIVSSKVDREIKMLKEKKQQLEQQIQSASGDEKKIRELEKKLAQVENELSQKDNDTYRRQNASVSEVPQ